MDQKIRQHCPVIRRFMYKLYAVIRSHWIARYVS